MTLNRRDGNPVVKAFIYFVCIVLAILSLFPFVVMVVNSTRSTFEIQQHAVSLIPSSHLMDNFKVFEGKPFNPWRGFLNSLIVAVGATALTVYFSTLTAYALVAYTWKGRVAFFTFILCVVHVPDSYDQQSAGADPACHLRAWVGLLHAAVYAGVPAAGAA